MRTPEVDSINIVVLIALPDEHDIFLNIFPSVGDVSTDTLVRLVHDFGVAGHTLTSVLATNMGADLAGSAAYAACEDLHPDLIICVGIAGGLSDDLNLGDVAASNEIVDILHNAKVADDRKRGTRSELSPRNYPVDTALQASCRFLRSHPGLKEHFEGWVATSAARRDEVIAKLGPDVQIVGLDATAKTLSTPLALILLRLANHAGVRSLKPIVENLKPNGEIEALLRGSWFMEVEAADGKKALKAALRNYRGSDLFRFVLANHLMWRVFWHHWQLRSRSIFIEAAKSIMKGLGLIAGKRYEQKMLAGPQSDD